MGNPQSEDKLISAGDVIVEDIILSSYNGFEMSLMKLLAAFNLYEDIYSNGISGYIMLFDSQNLAKNVPIIGQEEVTISFKTPGKDTQMRTVRLKVYKISTQTQGDEGNVVTLLKLELVSPLVTLSNTIKMNRVMKNLRYSDMVTTIYKEMKKVDSKLPPLYVENTAGKSTVIIPNWSPLYTINWLGYRSVAESDNMSCDYMFYQTLDGYHFKSLSNLKKKDSVKKYINLPAGSRHLDTGERLLEREMSSILEHTIGNVHDTLKRTTMGMYSATQLVHEMTTKSYYRTNYSYRDTFNEIPHLNKNRITNYDNSLQDSTLSYMKYHIKSHYSLPGVEDANYVDKALIRQAQLNLMNTFTMTIRVFGDTTLRVGNVIDIDFTSAENKAATQEESDRYLSGRYMIMCILHDYKQGLHEMLLTVSRDSYSEPIPDKKQKDLKFA